MKALYISIVSGITMAFSAHVIADNPVYQLVENFKGNNTILVDATEELMHSGDYAWDRCFVSNFSNRKYTVYVSDYRRHNVVETDMFVPISDSLRREFEHDIMPCEIAHNER